MSLNFDRALHSLHETQRAIGSLDPAALRSIAEFIARLEETAGILWTIGNGGSASTGAHLACDIGKGVSSSRNDPLRAISINEQVVAQSAWANDFGFESALRNQLEQLARPGDAILAISGSGNSPNLLEAARWARTRGFPLVALLGRSGGALYDFADIALRVDSDDMQVIENVHLAVVHWLYKALNTNY